MHGKLYILVEIFYRRYLTSLENPHEVPMTNKTLKFAILGCGHIATKMAKAVKALETRNMGVECYAVASRTLDKAKKFADDYGFGRAYGSYEELARDPAVDSCTNQKMSF